MGWAAAPITRSSLQVPSGFIDKHTTLCVHTCMMVRIVRLCVRAAGVFTATNERVHGRLAMLGLGSLLAIELVLGRALL